MADENDNPIAPEVVKLLREHIRSVHQLEVLLLCHRSAERTWTAAEVSDELRSTQQMASSALSDLSYRGFLEMTDHGRQAYVYRPESVARGQAVAALASIYPAFRHRIIELVVSPTNEALKDFADAFKLRKD